MSGAPGMSEDEFIIHPSLARNLLYALTSATIGVVFIFLAQSGETKPLPAYLAAIVLTVGAGVLLAAHFPNSSYLRLTRDGFEIRELFKSRHYRWDAVTAFAPRRRLLGTTIEFAYFDPATGQPEGLTMPGSFAISTSRLVELMNEWRERAIGPDQA